MNPNAAPATTSSYALGAPRSAYGSQHGVAASLGRLWPVARPERRSLATALGAVVVSTAAGLLGPLVIARTVDTHIGTGNFAGVLQNAGWLLLIYLAGGGAMYLQSLLMGGVGRRVLFALRNTLFTKLQELPLDFFNQNKAGDLISRINNDTDRLNQFFAQGLVQLASNGMLMAGAAVFVLSLNVKLGLVALAPAAAALLFARAWGPFVKRRNVASLQALGGLSGEVQESLANFKVIVAFNRRDYFREKFELANERNFIAAVAAAGASNVLLPVNGLAYSVAQILVLMYGVHLVTIGEATVGLLIAFLLYVNSLYMPLRQLAAIWASFQLALAGLDRVSAVLALESNMPVLPAEAAQPSAGVLAFEHVRFAYPGGAEVLHDASFTLERGKTYALVGPTGGGKSTTAALMARLYDPSAGRVLLDGRDIRSVEPKERARRIGFILQEPFLFSGTVRDNIVYGNDRYRTTPDAELMGELKAHGLDALLERFDGGLATPVTATGDAVSLGQKQLIAFMRAVLLDPELLILDEATANIDTVTEQQLERILARLPSHTTKVVIAHRLNTIADADEIFFVNAGTITPAGSMAHALDLLLHGRRAS